MAKQIEIMPGVYYPAPTIFVFLPMYDAYVWRWSAIYELSGVLYTMDFSWNGQAEVWELDIWDGTKNVLYAAGLNLLPGVQDILADRRVLVPELPPGSLFLFDKEDNDATAIVTANNLSERFNLAYLVE